jgi:hypothetical protein
MKATTLALIMAAKAIFERDRPLVLSLRQLYYQLVVAKQVTNSPKSYKMVGRAMVRARKEGIIPWEWMEDRLRRPRAPQMWPTVGSYLRAVRHSFRADIWEFQPRLTEVWIEKEALAGIFQTELYELGMTLNVGRGYDSLDSIRNAALRYRHWAEHRSEIEGQTIRTDQCTVLYYGDWDPSGADMDRSLKERLNYFGAYPHIIRCAITPDDIERYNLPPDPTKTTDSRSPAFIALHGRVSSVELDALPVRVLRARIQSEAARRIDRVALQAARDVETEAQVIIDRAIGMAGDG